jgi:hypothetical protein
MRFLASVLTTVLTTSALVAAQPKPDFSGVWVEDQALRKTTLAVTPGAKSMALPERDTTIKQTADAIVIEMAPPAPGFNGLRHAYDLSGKQSVNKNGANTQTTKSRWDGGKLVTEGTSFSETNQGEFHWKYVETRWMDAQGRMVLETKTTDESGKTNVVTRTFNKKK